MKGEKISFIGGGNMAEAMLRGLLKKKIIAGYKYLVVLKLFINYKFGSD